MYQVVHLDKRDIIEKFKDFSIYEESKLVDYIAYLIGEMKDSDRLIIKKWAENDTTSNTDSKRD